MSSKDAKPNPEPAWCEDVDETEGTALPGTKVSASANTKVKRSSRESLDDDTALVVRGKNGGSIAGDSGYSSQAATTSSTASNELKGYRRERQTSKRSDSGRQSTNDAQRSESRSDRRRSTSRQPEGSKSKSRRNSEAYYQEDHEPEVMEKASRRRSREVPIREARATTPQPQTRPKLERSHSTSHRSRPVSADFSRLAIPDGGYRYPPSAFPGPGHYYHPPPSPQPLYNMGPPPAITRVANVPYTVQAPVYEASRPQQMLRRQTVNYGHPAYHVSQTPTAFPVQYSATAIPNTSVPAYNFTTESYESVVRRQRAEEALRKAEAKRLKEELREHRRFEEARQHAAEERRNERARLDEEERINEDRLRALRAEEARRADAKAKAARREMPPPSRRPSTSRRQSVAEVHQSRPKESSRRGSNGEPPSPSLQRPSSRQAVSYSGSSRRNSSVYPLARRSTVDGHENGHDLDKKVDAAERHMRNTDTKPRMDLTPAAIKTTKSTKVPSKAGSHVSRGSRDSGHKSSRSNGGITLLTDDFSININDPKDNRFSFKSSDRGVLLTVGDEGRKTRTMLISKDNGDGRSVVSGASRQSKGSGRSKK